MEPLPKLIHNTQSNHFSGTAHCALEILTDHAEIHASIFRGAIAEKEGAQRLPIFLPCPRRLVLRSRLARRLKGVAKDKSGRRERGGKRRKSSEKGWGPESPGGLLEG